MTQFHEDTSEMTGGQLVAFYNRLAAAAALLGVPAKPVNRFADAHKGRQRCETLRMQVNDAARAQPEVSIDLVSAKLAEEAVHVPETLRQDTLAKQEAAMKAVRPTQPPEESKMAATKKKASPKPKTNGVAVARGFAEDAKIKILVKVNPRRGEAAKRFEIYKDDMTVAEYTKKIGSRAEALVHLRWDVKNDHISVK